MAGGLVSVYLNEVMRLPIKVEVPGQMLALASMLRFKAGIKKTCCMLLSVIACSVAHCSNEPCNCKPVVRV